MFFALSGLNKDFFCFWGAIIILGASRALSYFFAKNLLNSYWLNYTCSTDSQKESFTFDIYTVDQFIILISFFAYLTGWIFREGGGGGKINGNGESWIGGSEYPGGGGGGGGGKFIYFDFRLPRKFFYPELVRNPGKE